MGKPGMDKGRKGKSFTQSKQSGDQHFKQSKERIKKEKDETYIPTSDSSDSEEDDSIIIHSGGSRGNPLINSGTLHDSFTSALNFSNEQKLLLEEQMRMCVQLTTQAYLLSFGIPPYGKLILSARKHLQEMTSLVSLQTDAGKKSCFEAVNLSDAMAIIKHFDLRNSQSSETVHEAKRVLCESKVFMYPDLCPEKFFTRPKFLHSKSVEPSKIKFHEAEDNLIILGLETFSLNLKNLKKIQEYYLPCRTKEEIHDRVVFAQRSSRRNVIKHFRELGEVPEFPMEIVPFDDKNIKAPIEQDLSILPKWMGSYVDIFERNGPFPYFLESYFGIVVKNNFEISAKSLCKNIKMEEDSKPNYSKTHLKMPMSLYKYKPKCFAVNKEIDLCQDVCDPSLVNTNFNELTDLDLDISMNGGIKLSALKKSKSKQTFMPYNVKKSHRESEKSTSYFNPRSNNAIKLEIDLHNESEDLCSKFLTSSCKLNPRVKMPTSAQDISFNQAASHFENKTVTPSITINEPKSFSIERDKNKAGLKLVTIKLENGSDAILPTTQSDNTSAIQNVSHVSASSSEIFPAIKIKEEPL